MLAVPSTRVTLLDPRGLRMRASVCFLNFISVCQLSDSVFSVVGAFY